MDCTVVGYPSKRYLFLDDGELRDDFFHTDVSGLLVFAKSWIVEVHLLESQKVLSVQFPDLSKGPTNQRATHEPDFPLT